MKYSRFKRWSTLIVSFLVGQGSVQVINLISGLLLLRWLSVEAYAQFSVAFGFQCTLNMLVDMGCSGSIIALIGDRCSDKEVVGSYIRSAKHFRNRLLAILIPLSAIAFAFVTSKQNWDWTTQLLLFGAVVNYLFFEGWAAYYSVPLLIHQQLKQLYKFQIISACVRLVLCFSLFLGSALSSWAAAWANSSVVVVQGFFFRKDSTRLIHEPIESNLNINREMQHYLLPLIPGIIFTAFQGQISVFLISFFGQTKSIAEVGALGRIGQLFLILSAFNGVVIAPYLAKVARQDLVRRYCQILGAAITISLVLSIGSFMFPQPLLWVLGSKYYHLRTEVGWMVVGASISYIGSVMLTMQGVRKWVYWWATFVYVVIVMLTQIGCLMVIDLSTTINVIYFGIITNLSALTVYIVTAIYGFIYGPRKTEIPEIPI